jgi:ATP-dependent Lon protease
MRDIEIKDLIFIIVFATLIFFGALFLFVSLKEPSLNKQVSVRALEKNINAKVNKRIQKMQSRNLMLRSKMKNFGKVSNLELSKEANNLDDSKYKIDIFESKQSNLADQVPKTASEKIMALLSSEDASEVERARVLQQYKSEMIQKAREEGWAIEISDDLEVTSAKKL